MSTQKLNNGLLPQPEKEKLVDPGLESQAFPSECIDRLERSLETQNRSAPSRRSAKEMHDYLGRPTGKFKLGGYRAAFFVLGLQFASTLAFYGTATNLVNFLTTKLHESNASAASNVNNWSGTVYVCSVIGGYLGDAYLGRFKSSVIFIFTGLTGMILLTISVSLHSLRPPDCASNSTTCLKASTKEVGFFYFSIYVLALGVGAFLPCNTAFGADQFDEHDSRETIQKSEFFSWLYLSMSAGGFIGNALIVYVAEYKGYALGFSIPTAVLGFSLLLYISGMQFYRHEKVGQNPFVRILQVPIAAIRKYGVKVPQDANLLYQAEEEKQSHRLPHTHQFRFLDKAATMTKEEEQNDPWLLCSVNQVEEVKCLLQLMPIWATGIFFSTIYSQILTLFVEQGSTMNTHIGSFTIPASLLNCIETLSVCVCSLAFETVLVPVMRRFSGNPRGITLLQRIGVGFVLSILAVMIAAVVEIKRLKIIKHHGLAHDMSSTTTVVPMSVFWLVPPFFLVGASEIFTFAGRYEFFYDQVPPAIRGIGSGLQFFSIALGSFLSSGLVNAVSSITKRGKNPGWVSDNLNSGNLDYFYWLLVILGILNFLFYLICARWYKYKSFESEAATHPTSC